MHARVVSTSLGRWLRRVFMCWLLALTAPWAYAGGTILIAAEDDWPPYSSIRPGTEYPQGFAVDLVREAFATQEIHARFVVVPFARCLHLARIGEVAGCFNTTKLSDNSDLYHWHATPLFYEELAIFARADSSPRNLTLGDLEGQTVGYTIGYTYTPAFHASRKIRKAGAKSDRVLLEMLRAKRVDYVLMNTAPALLRINAASDLKGRIEKVGVLSQDGFWIAFSRATADGARQAETFEKGLQALKSSGRYDLLYAEFRRKVGF